MAIADGFQIDVTATAKEAGISFPVFITRGVYELCVAVPPGVTNGRCGSHQDEAGRLWDVVWMLRFAIIRSQPGAGDPCGSHPVPERSGVGKGWMACLRVLTDTPESR